MQLFLIRHGECLGQCDPSYARDPDSPLSALGHAQSRQVARLLRGMGVTQVLSSPLIRSMETASLIVTTLDLPAFAVWMELREGFSHTHRGAGAATLREHFPLAMLPEEITDSGWDHGNDTYPGWDLRCRQIVDRLRLSFGPTDRVALVTHGGLANYLLHTLLGIPAATPQWFELNNCSLNVIRLVPDPVAERPDWPLYPPVTVEILSLNDSSHLVDIASAL
ncbi:MAG: histidine phosphatase family protein [Herpetosiphonaceae bacterium]|nr:histidine phosphatase family protein [Herpetosiphonaceae bacterium]